MNMTEVGSLNATASMVTSARRHLRGRRGGLKDMLEMPLDILFEIFGFMHPRDLLNLARTSRDFRTLLMSKRSTSFWKAAREQIEDLPKPPFYLSEPAYANLLFFPHCHNCLKPNINVVIWIFSARYCKNCQKELFQVAKEQKLLIDVFQRIKDDKYPQWSDYKFMHESQIFRRYNEKIFKPEVEMMEIQWAALIDDNEKEAYLNERQVFVAECREYATLLTAWKSKDQMRKCLEAEQLRSQRLIAVKGRLREEGWGNVLDYIQSDILDDELMNVNAVNRPNRLSDKAWKTMRPSLIKIMKEFNQERLKEKYYDRLQFLKQAIQNYRTEHCPYRTAPSDREPGLAEFAHMPEYRDVIMQEEPEDIFKALIASLLDDIPNQTAAWVYDNEDLFVAMALSRLGDDFKKVADHPPTFFALAIVSFVCTKCKRAHLRWPKILAHRCLRQHQAPDDDDDDDTVDSAMRIYELVVTENSKDYDAPFKGAELTNIDPHIDITRAIISACGLDPTTATHIQMEECKARFARSGPDANKRHIYNWKGVLHYFDSQGSKHQEPFNLSDYFERVSEIDAATAITQETTQLDALFLLSDELKNDDKQLFGCDFCQTSGSYRFMQDHLAQHLSNEYLAWTPLSPMRLPSCYLHEDSQPEDVFEVFI